MSDGIIDLTQYRRGRDGTEDRSGEPGSFALWGADGERSRFALPLWRLIYLAGGDRGGILRTGSEGSPPLDPFVVLDLRSDPPRLDFPAELAQGLRHDAPPELDEPGGGEALAIFLGPRVGPPWYLVVTGRSPDRTIGPREREDILFLAGECAGLLFLRAFAELTDE